MLQNDPLRRLPFNFDAYPDPDLAFRFDAVADPEPAFHCDTDPDARFQNDADPDPQHLPCTCLFRSLRLLCLTIKVQ
jgi:hypothetical protein